MLKRVMIGLFAMSVVVMLWTEANAGCVDFGGSLFCADWLTGSVDCTVKTTKLNCTSQECDVSCTATNTTSPKGFAFCQKGDKVTPRTCNIPFHLFGSSFFESDDCGPLHNGGQVCKKTIQLKPIAPADCNTCCNTGETCVDFTPQAMDTTATIVAGSEESALMLAAPPNVLAASSKDDDEGDDGDDDEGVAHCSSSFSCTLKQLCTINPNQIQYLKSRPYTCTLKSIN